MEGKQRETLNIVVVGHVDHGKSTLIGRLLYDTESLPEGAIDKVKALSKEKGKAFEYAFLLDAFEEEQEQGITIDTTQLQFSTQKRDFVIIDAPGHKEFLKNMISGAANAEAAFLMVDAKEGIKEQSRRHGYILSLLGIKKVYVIINKMDLVAYDEARYLEIKKDFNAFLNGLNIYPMGYIPVSAFHGENIVQKSNKMPWNKTGSIIQVMESIEKEKDLDKKPLRFPIQDVYKFDDRRIIAGRIEAGTLKVGDEVLISPANKTTKVKTIEYWAERDKIETVTAGMSVGITLEDEFFNKRGEMISHVQNAPLRGNIFHANIFWMGKNDLVKDKKYKLKIATKEVECSLLAIHKVIDASTLSELDDSVAVKKNDVAKVTLQTKEMICFDAFSTLQTTGRFVLVDGLDVSGGGIIAGIDDALKDRHLSSKSANIVPRERFVTREEREKAYNQQGQVIWLTGLSGSGKHEIAARLEKKLFNAGKKVYYLEANNIRFGLSQDLGFSKEDAKEQTRRMAEVARLFVDSGFIVIVSVTSPYKEHRQAARDIIGEAYYKEIYVEKESKQESNQVVYEKSTYPVVSLFMGEDALQTEEKLEAMVKLMGI